ncbi:trithorax group protein osa isoform X1 [Prunus avium]|uniref:Trithorax group protein osa isoform X1 n=1 Tax=Prunus avium TaxID=42229 RepID=A0A6P5TJK2_PRUAV|nr:trithorax group protein osa isoform X1 [Prunus avium]
MASGSSGRANPGSQGFDFASDDILCSYEDYGNQDSSNGNHSDPVMGNNPSKQQDFHKSRMARQSMFSSAAYSQPEDSLHQDVIATVEKSMKKYADNLMRFLEGISSRLSQLELYCYNLDKSIGEMRSDLVRDHGEADSKLKSLEKHLNEVHRSVQILRDKQELAETQKELAKLQLAQKGSGSSIHSQPNEERASPPTSDGQKTDNTPETNNQQLALALPHQVAPQPQPVAPPPQAPTQNVTQQQSYYLSPTQLQNPPPPQHSQNQYLPSDSQYRTPQVQDIPRVAPQPTQSQVNQTPQVQSFPQYQQLPQPQQVQFPQQPSMQPQMRPPSTTNVYPSYPPGQQTNPSPPEAVPSSMSMQVPYSSIPQQGSGRSDAMPFGYSGAGRPIQQQPPPQQLKGAFGAQAGEGYAAAGPHPALPPGSTYMMYDGEGGRTHYSAQVPHYGYPPTSAPHQTPQPTTAPNLMARNPQFIRNHPYSELIEKLASMGFRSDHVLSVIQRMEERGEPIDFNAVIDRLSNVHSSGGPQRGWSG